VIIYTLSTDGILTALNPVFEQVTGWSRDEWLGRPFVEMFYPDDAAFAMQQFQRVLQGAGEGRYSEMRIQSKSGAVLTIEVVGVQQIVDGQMVGISGFARDITARKRAEEALTAERALLRTLVDHLPDAVYVKDVACRKTLANPADLRNMGAASEAEVLGKTDFELFPHDLATAFYADDQSVIQSGRPVLNREEVITLPDGTRGWQLTSKVPVRNDAGQVVGLVGIGHDITERKQAVEELQQRAWQLALLNEIGGQVAALLDVDQVLDRAAHLVQERFGFHHVGLFTRATGEDRLVMRARAGEFAPLFPADHNMALGQGMVGWVGLHGETLLANDVDAEPHYINLYPDRLPTRAELSVPIRIGDEIVGVLDLQSPQPNAFDPGDVTTLETLAAQMAVVIHNARLYSQAAQRNRELTLLNRVIAATAAAGETLESVLEAVCRELALAFEVPQAAAALFNEEKSEATVVAEYLAPGRPPSLGATIPAAGNPASQHLLMHKTPLAIENAQTDPRLSPIHGLMGQRGTVSLLLLPLIVEGEVVGSLGVDAIELRPFSSQEVALARRVAEQVSAVLARARLREEHRQLEEQFRQAQKMEAIGRLAGGIAHDFNNLLTVIHLSTRLLERNLHPQDPLYQHVQRIQDSGRRATNLIKQLLAFSRREIVEPQILNLNDLIGDLSKMLQRMIGEDVELVMDLAEDLWPVEIDPTQVDQVLMNLAVNARDAMPAGGRLTLATANVMLDEAYAALHLEAQPGEYVLLAVSDTGVGMDDEVKAHLFEPFFTTKEKGKGTGLGLATVYGIVKQNGGHIGVYSEEGLGTTLRIYLPHTRAKLAPAPSRAAPVGTSRGTETILVVEDRTEVRDLTGQVLSMHGYQVLAAGDGIEALQICRGYDSPIHLLLTDLVMPDMNGRELAEQLRLQRPEMRVLYMSGYADRPLVKEIMDDQGATFLPKPFTVESLVEKVRAVLGGQG
jgi:two-component system cell cycle sensor histidine kinase/response regulator CckA